MGVPWAGGVPYKYEPPEQEFLFPSLLTSYGFVGAFESRTSRILAVSEAIVIGFCRNDMLASRTPWRTMLSSV
jgi:hypothetical protein